MRLFRPRSRACPRLSEINHKKILVKSYLKISSSKHLKKLFILNLFLHENKIKNSSIKHFLFYFLVIIINISIGHLRGNQGP